jgi:hypothetical protein
MHHFINVSFSTKSSFIEYHSNDTVCADHPSYASAFGHKMVVEF